MNNDIGACVMNYAELEEICHVGCSEKIIYLCTDMTEKKEGKYRNCKESKTRYIECAPESEPF